MKNRTAIHLMLAALFLAACTPEVNGTVGTLKSAVEEGRYLYGHQDDLCYGHDWAWERGRSDVKDVCGLYPAVVGFDLGGIENGDSVNLDGVDFTYMRTLAEDHIARGGIVTFSWHPRNPHTGGSAWDIGDGTTVRSILEGGAEHEAFLGWLSNAADFLESVKTPEGKTAEAIFRPWHENMGDWFWWCSNVCTKEEYQSLWDLTYDYMVNTRGLKELVWAFSPNAGIDSETYMSRYPGDEIIDILGLDAYQYGSPESYISQLTDSFAFMRDLASEHGKLMALTEAGFEGIPQADWWTSVLGKALGGSGICYVLTWRNAWDRENHFYGPWKGAACEEDFRAFAQSDNTVFLK